MHTRWSKTHETDMGKWVEELFDALLLTTHRSCSSWSNLFKVQVQL